MVILLMALESVHILHPPYFFGLNTVGTTHGLKLSLTDPLSNNSWTWFFTSSFSRGVNLYVDLFGILSPSIKSM
jgi:hypothetical protein